jgi:hypothetical protein
MLRACDMLCGSTVELGAVQSASQAQSMLLRTYVQGTLGTDPGAVTFIRG